MFDANKIALEVVAIAQKQLNELARQLFFGGLESIGADPMRLNVSPLEDSPLRRRVKLLVSIANGESHHEGEVYEALLAVETSVDNMPPVMRRVIQHVQLWLNRDDLITLTEAAKILRGSAKNRDLVSINGYIQRGQLRAYRDPNEPNPQRARRVSRREIQQLKRTIQHPE